MELRLSVSAKDWQDCNDDPPPPEGVSIRGPIGIERYQADPLPAILGFVVTFAHDVAVPVLAAWLTAKFLKHNTRRININVVNVAVDRDEIAKVIEKELRAVTARLAAQEEEKIPTKELYIALPDSWVESETEDAPPPEGVEVKYHARVQEDATGWSQMLGIFITIPLTTIALNMVSAWLYDLLVKHKTKRIIIESEEIIVEQGAIQRVIRKTVTTDCPVTVEDKGALTLRASNMRRIGAMIGSPGDAGEERQAITEALLRWNAINRDKGIFIEPVRWETHATPGLQGRPQGMINAELLPISDILVAVFRSRAGSPTGKELSGTIEEIREFMRLGKYVVLYFYEGDVAIAKVDPDQLKAVNEFKKEIQQHGLTASYTNISELREHIICHLTNIVGKLPEPAKPPVAKGHVTRTNPTASDMTAGKLPIQMTDARLAVLFCILHGELRGPSKGGDCDLVLTICCKEGGLRITKGEVYEAIRDLEEARIVVLDPGYRVSVYYKDSVKEQLALWLERNQQISGLL
jgi:hypothetical protein